MDTTVLTIMTFGITRDITGANALHWTCMLPMSVAELKSQLLQKYPRFSTLGSLQIAVNATYAAPDLIIKPGDEIALIPPVSGG